MRSSTPIDMAELQEMKRTGRIRLEKRTDCPSIYGPTEQFCLVVDEQIIAAWDDGHWTSVQHGWTTEAQGNDLTVVGPEFWFKVTCHPPTVH